jgi:preprotein translocase subunit YajC
MPISPLAVAATAAPAWYQGPLPLMVIIFVIFYFLLIAPARKREKQRQAMLDAIERGDKIITTGGLYGEVAAVEPQTVLIKIGDGVKVRLAKSHIAGLQGEPEQGGTK